MSRRAPLPSRLLYHGLLLGILLAPASILAAADPATEYGKVIRTIRCDCSCHPQSVKTCACGRAAEMRETIAAMIEGTGDGDGMTAEAVIARYVAEHGEQIRIAPPTTGFSLLAWLGPLIGLALGLIAAAVLVRHLARRAVRTPPGVPAGAPPAETDPLDRDDPYRAKLQRQLEEWD